MSTTGDRGGGSGRRPADSTAPTLEGRRLAGARGGASPWECTYVVVEPPRPAADGEKRRRPRQRTRLRTGKIVDMDDRFVTECLIYDRSDAGGRLRLPAGIRISSPIQLYEDQSALLLQADVVWRMEREIGVRFRPSVQTPRSRAVEADMRRRFYAMKE